MKINSKILSLKIKNGIFDFQGRLYDAFDFFIWLASHRMSFLQVLFLFLFIDSTPLFKEEISLFPRCFKKICIQLPSVFIFLFRLSNFLIAAFKSSIRQFRNPSINGSFMWSRLFQKIFIQWRGDHVG